MSHGELQESEYRFPYHWIPEAERSWSSTRRLEWGLEYLGTLHAVLDAVVPLRPTRVLDFGCGDGRLACELSDAGVPNVVGVDLSASAIAFATAFAHRCENPPVFHAVAVAELDPRVFDVCVAMEVLEHISDADIEDVVLQIHRRLAEDGRFIVTVPSTRRPVHEKHYRHYDIELLCSQLAPYFALEDVRYVHRVGRTATALRRLAHNRLFDASNEHVLRWVTGRYKRSVQYATRSTGAHLLATFRREGGST